MIFTNNSYELWFWNWFVNAPTSPDFETHKTFDMHAEVHDLIKYMVLTYIYPSLSKFKVPKSDPFPSFLPHDQYARGVVVCFWGEVG